MFVVLSGNQSEESDLGEEGKKRESQKHKYIIFCYFPTLGIQLTVSVMKWYKATATLRYQGGK